MPELPEMEALAEDLGQRAGGRRVVRADLASLSALKTYDPPLGALVGGTVGPVERRGKFLCVAVQDHWLVVHLARAGWVRWRDPVPEARVRPGRGPLALRVALEGHGGFDITEMGTQKRLSLWVVADPVEVAPLAALGPDPLRDPPDGEWFRAMLAAESGTLKTVLTTQRLIAGIGNAYSDEILHAARLSPFRPANRLTDDEVSTLWAAVYRVLSEAAAHARGLHAADLKAEKKANLAVHGRAGLPCPVCGDTVREVVFAARALQYCPTCQTDGRVLADRRLSRLLK